MKNKKGLVAIFWSFFALAVVIVLFALYPIFSGIVNSSLDAIGTSSGSFFLKALIILIPVIICSIVFLVLIKKILGL